MVQSAAYPLGDIVGPGVVDQPLGERGGQHQLALSNGDEGVAQPVEPELGPARLADAGVEDDAGPGHGRSRWSETGTPTPGHLRADPRRRSGDAQELPRVDW